MCISVSQLVRNIGIAVFVGTEVFAGIAVFPGIAAFAGVSVFAGIYSSISSPLTFKSLLVIQGPVSHNMFSCTKHIPGHMICRCINA